ncbi:MAG: cytochrome [Geminicoccaceae bacterium]|nr:cytochrome [Geminicoccaceae bacterium]
MIQFAEHCGHYSPVPEAQAQSAASGPPKGEGRELVKAVCTGCDQTNQITRSSGYTHVGWQELDDAASGRRPGVCAWQATLVASAPGRGSRRT